MKLINKKTITLMFSAVALLTLTGCGSDGTASESQLVGSGCSTKEPAWTSNVAPMVTREDGGEAAAVVHAVDVVTSGALFNQVGGASAKVSSAGAKSGIDTLTKLFTPDMSAKSEKLAALKVKESTKSAPSVPEGPQECAYGGTVTVTSSVSMEDNDYSENFTYSFDNCVEVPVYIDGIVSHLSSIFGQAFFFLPTTDEVAPTTERVTLNGEIGATFRNVGFEEPVEADLPSWTGPASWSCYIDEGTPPVAMITDYLRGEIISDDFSAEFSDTEEEGSLLFSSSMDLYFEDRAIFEFLWDGPTANQMPEPGFKDPGNYLIAGANGCLEVTESAEGTTQSLLSMRALGLEAVMLIASPLDGGSTKTVSPDPATLLIPLEMKLDGFIEASMGEGELSLSLKADDFYRRYANLPYSMSFSKKASVDLEPTTPPTFIMGYLGSACMEGMLFVEGMYNYPLSPSIDALPEFGWIGFLNQAPCDESTIELGYIEFNTEEEPQPVSEPQIDTITTADLYVGEDEYTGFTSWSALIGENSCTIGLAP